MIRRKGLHNLPAIPANSNVPRSVVLSTFSAAAVILYREARVAGAGAAFFISIYFHRGSAVLRGAVTRCKQPTGFDEDPNWVPSSLAALHLLARRFPDYEPVFGGYARALQWLVDSSTYDSTPNPNNDTEFLSVTPGPEPRTRTGEIVVSPNVIALLNGLYDRPNYTATSRSDWALAASPYRVAFGGQWSVSSLRRATSSVHPAWVVAQKNGRNTQHTLSNRGRLIVERTVPVNVRGRGPYHGLRGLFGQGEA